MVVVAAHGRALLEDQGIHTYTPKLPEFRTLCDYNYGHNTVIVDGRSQPIREETAASLISSQKDNLELYIIQWPRYNYNPSSSRTLPSAVGRCCSRRR